MEQYKMDFLKITCCSFLLVLSSLSFAEPVNINVADADVIAKSLKGIGINKAALVVEYRDMHGSFTTVDEIALVKGIGSKTVELNRENILIE